MAPLLPGDRHLDGAVGRGGNPRLATVPLAARLDGVSGYGAQRVVERGEVPTRWPDQSRQQSRSTAADRVGLALSPSATGKRSTAQTADRAARASDHDRRSCSSKAQPALSTNGSPRQAAQQDRCGDRPRARGFSVGDSRRRGRGPQLIVRRVLVDGMSTARRRRGTTMRRQASPTRRANLESVPSRRSTVMRLCLTAIREYQSDSSSKRSRSVHFSAPTGGRDC